jgi:hypothetical protein
MFWWGGGGRKEGTEILFDMRFGHYMGGGVVVEAVIPYGTVFRGGGGEDRICLHSLLRRRGGVEQLYLWNIKLR